MFRVRLTFSCSNLHETTNSIIKISQVGMQLPQWWVTLHLYVGQYVQVQGNGCTLYLLTQRWVNLRALAEERQQTHHKMHPAQWNVLCL